MPRNPYSSWAQDRVARLLATGPRQRLVAVVVASIDGVIAVDGRSAPLSSDQDRALIGAWREAADALLVGPATLAAELYGGGLFPPEARARRRGRGLPETPPIATIDRSGALDLDRALRAREPLDLVVYTPVGGARDDPRASWVELEEPSLTHVTADLRRRLGHRTIVAEPGPRLLESLVREQVLSDLSLTISAQIVGRGPNLWWTPESQRPSADAPGTASRTQRYPDVSACTRVDMDRLRSVDADVLDGVIFVHFVADAVDPGATDGATGGAAAPKPAQPTGGPWPQSG